MSEQRRPLEDDLIRYAQSRVPEMTDAEFRSGRDTLLAFIEASEEADDAGSVGTARPRRSRGRWLVAAAAAVVLVAGALLFLPSSMPHRGGGTPGVGSAAAAELLIQAAGKVGDATLQPGQCLYVLENARFGNVGLDPRGGVTWMYLQPQKLETWVPADRDAEWLHRRSLTGDGVWLIGGPQDLPQDRWETIRLGEWRAKQGRFFAGDPDAKPQSEVTFGAPTPEYLAGLPRDPAQLYEKLRGETSEDLVLGEVNRGLASGLVSADLRAAVYEALAHLPNLEVVDKAVDLDGRQGIAFGRVGEERRHDIIIDPADGEYLGSREVLVRDWQGLQAGTTVNETSLSYEVVGALGATR